MKKLCFAIAWTIFLAGSFQINAAGYNQNALHTHLLPNLGAPFAVALYLPKNYVSIRSEGMPSDEYILGPNDLGKNFVENPRLLTKPVIHVAKEDGIKSFSVDMKQMIAQMKKEFPKGFEAAFSQWGNYPLVAIKMIVGKDVVHMAYVGLNDRAGNVLVFHLIYPTKKDFGNSPSKEDLALWVNFLNGTKPLNN
ncbi:putative uncharacterized protein [Parachlamydia acanthamoebae UV-7]|jgi:hypothetical protein|uniref:PsbP C-terminal domain-containing protein n=2 Tax=Parachlamydia acanthamoebae TaxID=83552 RepID=F8L0H4_PARAV|nr:hypothetical protein [Parachlamydia acanthamoebae]EFB41687.1 hypothetical protein pah_c026o139 [Parachlamydia acanthamoebae str. Hall's coccus]KIA77626.1 hypothetical protein DB43_GD00570 [Parachlamydia acanthamoebae]CCB86714.1 putative uncharacterized protein [Parachlamydia acanthamoebae UV-7]